MGSLWAHFLFHTVSLLKMAAVKKHKYRDRKLAEGNCEILGQFEMLAVLERFTS